MQAPLEKEKQRHNSRTAVDKCRLLMAGKGLILVGFILCFPAWAHSWESRFSGEINEYVSIEKNYSNISYFFQPLFYQGTLLFREIPLNREDFTYDDTYNVLILSPEFHFSNTKGLSGFVRTDLSWLHSWNDDTDNNDEIEFLSAYLNLTSKKISLQLGLFPFYMGNGLIINDYEPGLTLDYRAKKNLYFSLNTALIRERSPLTSLSVGYIPRFLEKIELFGAWLHDIDNAFAEKVRQSVNYHNPYYFNEIKNKGDLFWYGLLADLFLGDVFLSLAAIGQYGIFHLDHTLYIYNYSIANNTITVNRMIEGQTDFILPAYLIDLEASYNINGWLTLGVFFFLSPGDTSVQQGSSQQHLTTFLAPAPYMPRSTIFFNGGLNGSEGPEALYNTGVRWSGTISPGLELYLQPTTDLSAEINFGLFFPQKNPFETFRWYGWETDVNISYNWRNKHQIFFQAALFHHADFIAESHKVVMEYYGGLYTELLQAYPQAVLFYQDLFDFYAKDIDLEPIMRFMIGYTFLF